MFDLKFNKIMCRQQIVISFSILWIGSGSVLLTLGKNIPPFSDDDDKSWPGLWFPARPNELLQEQTHSVNKSMQSNLVDDANLLQMAETNVSDGSREWKGPWFPAPPGQVSPIQSHHSTIQQDRTTGNGNVNMGDSNFNCDDGVSNLAVDYDPANITHHSRHMCLNERILYSPSYKIAPQLSEYIIPPEYSALHKCMDQPIEYDDVIPTFGTHRKLWPVYGEYVYVPPQRWIHSLEHGGIVFLYHPCANLNQLDIVKSLIKKCLYRHIITANDLLEPERPFALIAWGRSLEFSVADQLVIVSFIRLYALQGPEKIFSDGQYNQTLIEKANIISSADDDVLCQNL